MKFRFLSVLALVLTGSAACISADLSGNASSALKQGSKVAGKAKKFKNVWDAWKDAIESISPDDERAIGSAAALNIIVATPGHLKVDDRDLLGYVNDVGNQVALAWQPKKQKSGRPRSLARRVFVGILNDDASVNAMSTPGGNLFVTTGLLRELDSESELAWVLGHEIAHVDHEDGLDALKASKSVPAAAQEFFLGGGGSSLAGMFLQQPVFNEVAEKIVDVIVSHAGFYGRAEERAADATGLDYAVDAGYDPKGAERVLRKLTEIHHQGVADDASHGSPAERLEALAPKLQKKNGGKSGFDRYQEMVISRLGPAQEVEPAE